MLLAAVLVLAVAVPAGPCALVTRNDIRHVLHWTVRSSHDSSYHLPQTSGSLCTYDAEEGTLLVTVPDRGSSFFQNNDLVDPFKNGLGTRVTGIPDAVELFDNVAYVSKHGRSVSVTILPNSGSTDATALTAFAKAVSKRLP